MEPLLNSAGKETLPEEPQAVQWCKVMEGCVWKDLVLCPAMNPHIHPSASGVLGGRRGWMEVAQCAGRMQLGQASPALSDGSDPREGKDPLLQTV